MSDYIENYKKYTQAIIDEQAAVFKLLDMDQLKAFMDAIIAAKHVFIHGTGREGISMRGFAMRLAHLGKQTYWLMDDTTIGMHEGDLLIMGDGGGNLGIHRPIVENAAKTGAKIAFVTTSPEGDLVKKYADVVLFIHSTSFIHNGSKDDVLVPTIQPMGNQFEQQIYLLMDVVSILLKDEMHLTYEDMEGNHRNIEN